jgi:hypothetical protein
MRVKINFLNMFVLISSLLSFFVIIYNTGNIASGYNLVIVFPLFYVVIYFLSLGKLNINKCSIPVTTYMFLILQWLRYVLTPSMIALSGDEAGTLFLNPEDSSLYLATILMLIDLVVTFFVVYFLAQKKYKYEVKSKMVLRGNKFVYIAFILLALAIYIYIGRSTNMLNFIIIPVENTERLGDITSTPIVIARQIVMIAIFLVFLWSVSIFSKKYNKNSRKLYFYIPVIFALINVSIIIGERRSAQVYSAFCSIWVLSYAYPKLKKKIILSVGGLAITVLTFMSIYKFSGAFIHGSYSGALQNSNFDAPWLSRTLQSYFAGPQDLAVAIDFAKVVDLTPLNLIFDFLRSTVPISFFVKGGGAVTSEIFNNFIYNGIQSTGHVISSNAYSYIYFGIFFSSFFSVVNILISYYFEKKMKQSVSFEMMFLWGYVLMRFALNLTANTPTLVSSATIMLMTGGLLFKTASILKLNNSNKIRY